ncbi:MAG: DUF4065 domain-containing protein [Balneolaceae bacterium]|nr:DUF4065 domain-containing protein [Balneolaceae bacterium]
MNKFELAKYIAEKYSGTVSPMKLQKLLYYCYAWQLVAGKKYFDASFQAWKYGPVDPDIFYEFKSFSSNPIVVEEAPLIQEQLIDFVLDSYAVYSAIELSKTTHEEEPWKMHKSTGGLIPDEALIDYYSQQAFAKNFPIEEGKTYYPPKTSAHYAFTFDMDKEYVPEFSSIHEYLDSFSTEKARLSQMLSDYGIQS